MLPHSAIKVNKYYIFTHKIININNFAKIKTRQIDGSYKFS